MTDEQPSFIRDDKELLEVVFGIDPRILTHFRLVEVSDHGVNSLKINRLIS